MVKKTMPPNWLIRLPAEVSAFTTLVFTFLFFEICKSLPVESENVFTNPTYIERELYLKRKRLASKLQNPRLLNISFRTFRHWKAAMEYHETRDILHVNNFWDTKTSTTR